MTAVLVLEQKLTHSAKYSPETLDVCAMVLAAEKAARGHRLTVLDTFAGTGQKLMAHPMFPDHDFVGVELQEAWAAVSPWVRQGNAKALPFDDASIDVVCTDPVWPNRMRDSYKRRDRCKPCNAEGQVVNADTGEMVTCPKCSGAGARLQKRYTYQFAYQETVGDINAKLDPDNVGAIKGRRYWEESEQHVAEWFRVLKPGGLACIVMGDSIEKGKSNEAVRSWRAMMTFAGFAAQTVINASIKHIGHGENRDDRLDAAVIVMRKPA